MYVYTHMYKVIFWEEKESIYFFIFLYKIFILYIQPGILLFYFDIKFISFYLSIFLRISLKFIQTEITFIPFPMYIRPILQRISDRTKLLYRYIGRLQFYFRLSLMIENVATRNGGEIYFSQDQSMKNKRTIAFRHR